MISYCRNLEDVIIQRGIAADPILQAQDWQAHRPRDLALRTMIGAQPGTQRLFAYPNFSQSSTGAPFIRDHLARHGLEPPVELEVPVVTANDLLASHPPGQPLHLVSIDVEGMEAEVLSGLDLLRHRPWLMVIEAVLSGTPPPTPPPPPSEPPQHQKNNNNAKIDGVNTKNQAREKQKKRS